MVVIKGRGGYTVARVGVELFLSGADGLPSTEIIASVEALFDRLVNQMDDENGILIEGVATEREEED